MYLQYSNRQEIVTSKNSGDVASNVLLVTIEGVEAGDVSIDVLHLVSSTSSEGVFRHSKLHLSGVRDKSVRRWSVLLQVIHSFCAQSKRPGVCRGMMTDKN